EYGDIDRWPRCGAVPMQRRLDQIKAKEARTTGNEQVVASQFRELFLEIGGYILEIILDNFLRSALSGLICDAEHNHEFLLSSKPTQLNRSIDSVRRVTYRISGRQEPPHPRR